LELFLDTVFIILGFVLLIKGADFMVSGASSFAKKFNVSEIAIGLTVVAMGTSAPELVVNLVSSSQGLDDVVFGNLIGSNIFNLLAVIGLTSIVDPIPVKSEVLSYDIFWVVGISLLLFPMMIYKRKIGRIGGVVLLGIYVTYIALLF
jgi:cation:H+ antiporter